MENKCLLTLYQKKKKRKRKRIRIENEETLDIHGD
jgi:hypothetical protein